MEADAGADDCFAGVCARREWIVGEAEARLGEELGAVGGECCGAGGGRGVDDAVREPVDSGAPVGGVPAVGGLGTDAGAEFEVGEELDGVFEVACDEGAAPAEFGGDGNVREGLDGALKEGGERGEAGLAVLILCEVVVGLEELEPAACLDLLPAAGVVDVIVEGEEVARGSVVGSDVGAGGGDGGGSVGGGGSGDDDCAGGLAGGGRWG